MAKKRHYSHEDHSAMRYEEKPMHIPERYAGAQKMKHAERGMIHEDWHAPALVPRGFMEKDWPRVDYGVQDAPPMLFSGVNRQMNEESSAVRRERSSRKF